MPESQPTLGVLLPPGGALGRGGERADVRVQAQPFDAVAFADGGSLPQDVDWWAVIEREVTLAPSFAAEMRRGLAFGVPAGALYSDLTVAGSVVRVGGWSVERARWHDYTGPVAVVASQVLHAVRNDGPAEVPLRVAALRLADGVRYLPRPLYRAERDAVTDLRPHWRGGRPGKDLPYRVTGDAQRPGRRLPGRRSVSIVIPTRGSSGEVRGRSRRLIDHCLERLEPVLAGDELDIDVVLVVDTDTARGYADQWARRLGDRLTIVGTDPPFNFSHKINAGVAAARGELVCLLNDDIEPITPSWLTEMVALACESDVGAVGALLLYEDGTVQHAGHVMGGNGVHLVDAGRRPEDGPRRRNRCDRDVSGVSAACLVQRKTVWQQLGGLDPAFPVSFNDVDYSERIRTAGLRVVQCNAARLYHFESRTRASGAQPQEVQLLRSRWGAAMVGPDPYTTWEPADSPAVRFPVLRYRARRIRAEYRAGGISAVLSATLASGRGRFGL